MSYVAAARALACAGFDGSKIELIVFGTTSYDDQVPNMASGIQKRIGADGCAAMDVNTACTSFLYSLSTATAMIKTGVVKNALVIGAELISPYMDWNDRNVAVLFGDGAAAVVLQATDAEEGLLAERLGCYGEAREILRVHGMGGAYAHQNRILGKTEWQFEGQEIFKKAVHGMASACAEALAKIGKSSATTSTSWFRTRPTCASSRRWPRRPACRWNGCSSTCIATATCRRPRCRWRCAKRSKKAA